MDCLGGGLALSSAWLGSHLVCTAGAPVASGMLSWNVSRFGVATLTRGGMVSSCHFAGLNICV